MYFYNIRSKFRDSLANDLNQYRFHKFYKYPSRSWTSPILFPKKFSVSEMLKTIALQ